MKRVSEEKPDTTFTAEEQNWKDKYQSLSLRFNDLKVENEKLWEFINKVVMII
jgi:hypothetical protein